MTYLLDTNTCIGWLRQNQPQIVARIQAQSQTDIVLCSDTNGPEHYCSEPFPSLFFLQPFSLCITAGHFRTARC